MNALTLDTGQWTVAGNAAREQRLDDPRREIVAGGGLLLVLLLVCGGWATTTSLDAAVTSPGTVRTSDSHEAVQSLGGGQIVRVLAGNGDRVRAGQPLVEFGSDDAIAQERSLAVRVIGLQMEIARLEASLRGDTKLATETLLAQYADTDRPIALRAIALEQTRLNAEHSIGGSEIVLMRDRIAQVGHQIEGNRQRLSSAQIQGSLNKQELAANQELLAKGLTTRTRVLALQRAGASYDGDVGAASAEIARLQSQAEESRLQALRAGQERTEQNSERLRQAEAEVQPLLPQWAAAREALARTVVRAPVDGVISADRMPTAGSVQMAGAKLFEIVPSTRRMVVEARIAVADAPELAPGQSAQVRLATLAGPSMPSIEGTIERVSADSIEDERTGQRYYAATIRIAPAAVAAVARRADTAGGILAGTPVQVTVATHRRTAWAFLTAPFANRLSGIFSQR